MRSCARYACMHSLAWLYVVPLARTRAQIGVSLRVSAGDVQISRSANICPNLSECQYLSKSLSGTNVLVCSLDRFPRGIVTVATSANIWDTPSSNFPDSRTQPSYVPAMFYHPTPCPLCMHLVAVSRVGVQTVAICMCVMSLCECRLWRCVYMWCLYLNSECGHMHVWCRHCDCVSLGVRDDTDDTTDVAPTVEKEDTTDLAFSETEVLTGWGDD